MCGRDLKVDRTGLWGYSCLYLVLGVCDLPYQTSYRRSCFQLVGSASDLKNPVFFFSFTTIPIRTRKCNCIESEYTYTDTSYRKI
jgi:hypothetical protein